MLKSLYQTMLPVKTREQVLQDYASVKERFYEYRTKSPPEGDLSGYRDYMIYTVFLMTVMITIKYKLLLINSREARLHDYLLKLKCLAYKVYTCI